MYLGRSYITIIWLLYVLYDNTIKMANHTEIFVIAMTLKCFNLEKSNF